MTCAEAPAAAAVWMSVDVDLMLTLHVTWLAFHYISQCSIDVSSGLFPHLSAQPQL